MDGLDCRALSDSTSQGAAAGWIGYTVNLQPHPFTELSLTNFQRSSSPLMRSSLDQSDHSRPERTETTRPVLSMMVSGSCLEGKKLHREKHRALCISWYSVKKKIYPQFIIGNTQIRNSASNRESRYTYLQNHFLASIDCLITRHQCSTSMN